MITVIVPCYNEEKSIIAFYNELQSTMNLMSESKFEVIFVNDGSKDNTLKIITDICEKDERVKYISFSRNFGKESAMYAGLCNSKGDYVCVIDADLQDPPSLLPKMFRIMEQDNSYDCVATKRISRKGEPPIRSFFANIFYKLINKISDADIENGARDFRLMKRKMVDAIIKIGEHSRFSKGIFGWVGFKTYWYPYENVERVAGETKWSFWKLFKYSVDGIVNFSNIPLILSSWIGLISTIISIVMIFFIAIRKLLFGDPVTGWASLVCIMIFIGGLLLLCMGVMGQYLAKIYMEVKNRPHYIINETNIEDAEYVKKN